MEIKAGETYYYIDNALNEFTSIVELRATRDAEGEISLPFTVVQLIAGFPEYIAHDDVIKPGNKISANQLNNVGVVGATHYIYKDKEAIDFIFRL